MKFVVGIKDLCLSQQEMALLSRPEVSGCVFLAPQCQSLVSAQRLIVDIRSLNPDIEVMLDHEGGSVNRFKNEPSVSFPEPLSWIEDNDVAKAQSKMVNSITEPLTNLRQTGFDRILGPCIDVHDLKSRVIGARGRAFSNDPDVILAMAKAWIGVCESVGLSTTIKHWPGHGRSEHDSHFEIAKDNRPYDELMVDASIYKKMIQAGYQDAVMPGHVIYSDVDELPASSSKVWYDLLKSWGFQGRVITDCFSMTAASHGVDMLSMMNRAAELGVTDFMLLHQEPSKMIRLIDAYQNQVHYEDGILPTQGVI